MTRPEGDYRYQCRLPPDNLGLQQDHRVLPGGRRLPNPPLSDRGANRPGHRRRQGFVSLPRVHGHRRSDGRAAGRPAGDRRDRGHDLRHGQHRDQAGHGRDRPRLHRPPRPEDDGRRPHGRRPFHLAAESQGSRRSPEYDSYQLRFADLQGRENQRPIRHRDRSDPRLAAGGATGRAASRKRSRWRPTGSWPSRCGPKDPDFALRRVTLRAQHDGRSLPIAPLLDKRKPEKAWPGEFSATYTFEPARLGLKAGDRVEYWAEAEDNKEPTPGQAASGRQRIVVVDPEKRKAAADERAGETASGDQGGDKGQAGEPARADRR